MHTALDVPTVDVVIQGGRPLFQNVQFRAATAYTDVPAGTYTLELRQAGQGAAVLTVPNVALGDGQVATIFATGRASDNSLAVPIAALSPARGAAAGGPAPEQLTSSGAGLVADSSPSAALWLSAAMLLLAAACALALRRASERTPVGEAAGDGPRALYRRPSPDFALRGGAVAVVAPGAELAPSWKRPSATRSRDCCRSTASSERRRRPQPHAPSTSPSACIARGRAGSSGRVVPRRARPGASPRPASPRAGAGRGARVRLPRRGRRGS